MNEKNRMRLFLLAFVFGISTFVLVQENRKYPEIASADDVLIPADLTDDFEKPLFIPMGTHWDYMIRPIFWGYSGRAYPVTNSGLEWETVQSQYDNLLQSYHFLQEEHDIEIPPAIQNRYKRVETMIWRRERYFGTQSEEIIIVWAEDSEELLPQLIVFSGFDY